jgi:hypothetical protein
MIKPFAHEIELEFTTEVDKAVVKDKILYLSARGIKMIEVEDGMFMLTCTSRTLYDSNTGSIRSFVSQV